MITLKMYADDSGTHNSSAVVVIGGLVGSVDQWTEFESMWGAKLKAPLPHKDPLRMFHLSHCNARVGEFERYSDGEQDAVTYDFREILILSQLIGLAVAIDKRAWDELARHRYGEAIEQCVRKAIEETIKIAEPHPHGDAVAVVFDRGMWLPKLKEITEPYTYPMGRPRIVSINPLAVADVYALQGADIVATENYWHAGEWLKLRDEAQPRAHLGHYLKNMIHEGLILDRAAIEEMMRADDLASGEQSP